MEGDVTIQTIETLAAHFQENAAYHAAEAVRAREQGNPALARHMQRLARLDYAAGWQHLVALLIREPIL
jgi:hypothetical protein